MRRVRVSGATTREPSKPDFAALIPELRREAYLCCGDRRRADVIVANALETAIEQVDSAPEFALRAWLFDLIEHAADEQWKRKRSRRSAARGPLTAPLNSRSIG